jgi:hypothetical protein
MMVLQQGQDLIIDDTEVLKEKQRQEDQEDIDHHQSPFPVLIGCTVYQPGKQVGRQGDANGQQGIDWFNIDIKKITGRKKGHPPVLYRSKIGQDHNQREKQEEIKRSKYHFEEG